MDSPGESRHNPATPAFWRVLCSPQSPLLITPRFLMNFFFDFLPIILFFVAYKFAGLYAATAVGIVATICQISWLKFRKKKVDTLLWISLAVIVVLGGATLLLHDETFIKWKPTVLYWASALVLGGARFLFQRNLMRRLLEEKMELPDPAWERLNQSWIGFFTIMGVLNLYVAFHYPTETWVNFKLFGGMGLMLVFVLIQGAMLSKYVTDEEKN